MNEVMDTYLFSFRGVYPDVLKSRVSTLALIPFERPEHDPDRMSGHLHHDSASSESQSGSTTGFTLIEAFYTSLHRISA
jgi:hypothetical protein